MPGYGRAFLPFCLPMFDYLKDIIDYKTLAVIIGSLTSIELLSVADSYITFFTKWAIGILSIIYLIYKIKSVKNYEH